MDCGGNVDHCRLWGVRGSGQSSLLWREMKVVSVQDEGYAALQQGGMGAGRAGYRLWGSTHFARYVITEKGLIERRRIAGDSCMP